MKTIVLARHAKSDWTQGLPDRERPLNHRGTADAPMMGKLLAAYGFQPDIVLSSPATRAKTTAQMVVQQLPSPPRIQIEDQIYHDGPGTIIGLIQDLPDEHDSVMLFGHNPTTEHIASYLLQMRGGIVVPTCGMVCIEMSCNKWKQISPLFGNLKWFLIPKLVKKFKA